MRLLTSFAVLSGTALLQTADALRVTPGSPCSKYCGNVLDNTVSSDMTCSEKSYATSSAGIVFQGCVNCELTSPYAASRQTDTQWMLYNMRYAISYCLFGFPDNKDVGSNPCITSTACEPLKNAITFNSLAQNGTSYDYCTIWRKEQVPKCQACLRAGHNYYLSNFLAVLDTGCVQQPIPGRTIAVEGEPFSTIQVNATDPSPTPSLAPDAFNQGPLSLGAKVGIVIGGIILLLSIIGCCIIWNGKRKRRRFLSRLASTSSQGGTGGPDKSWPTPTPPQPDMFQTPLSQRPLRGWDDSPMSAQTDATFSNTSYPRYFSPYSSQYNSPVSATEGPAHMVWPTRAMSASTASPNTEKTLQPPPDIGLALGGDDGSGHWDFHDAKSPDSMSSKGKERAEYYEMTLVDGSPGGQVYNNNLQMPLPPEPPVLHHPGYGRQGSPPKRYAVLTEEDARRGNAL